MKKVIKAIMLTLGAVLISMGTVGCTASDTPASNNTQQTSVDLIISNDIVRIGVFGDKPPFGYIDESGESQGFDIYLAKRLAKELLGNENKVEFILVEAASRVEYLQSGIVDIILANFTVTEERKQVVDFANPYMKVALGVVSSENTPITDISQLEGQQLIVNRGTTADAYFTRNHPEINLLKFDQNTEAFQALRDGRGVALAHDNTMLFAWVQENDGFITAIEALDSVDFIAPAVQKGNESLLNWINKTLELLAEENFMAEAYKATLEPIYGDSVEPGSIIID